MTHKVIAEKIIEQGDCEGIACCDCPLDEARKMLPQFNIEEK